MVHYFTWREVKGHPLMYSGKIIVVPSNIALVCCIKIQSKCLYLYHTLQLPEIV